MRTFSLVDRGKIQHSVLYDLLIDDEPVLTYASYEEAMSYALRTMEDDDEYREPGSKRVVSGKMLRAGHNSMEEYFARDGTYKPLYYSSPSTGEVEFSDKH